MLDVPVIRRFEATYETGRKTKNIYCNPMNRGEKCKVLRIELMCLLIPYPVSRTPYPNNHNPPNPLTQDGTPCSAQFLGTMLSLCSQNNIHLRTHTNTHARAHRLRDQGPGSLHLPGPRRHGAGLGEGSLGLSGFVRVYSSPIPNTQDWKMRVASGQAMPGAKTGGMTGGMFGS